jgi:RNA recognition motif-containing protein
MAQKLYVGNLNFRATEDEIRALFAQFGEVTSVNIVTDAATGRARGFAFVELATEEAANKAKEALNGQPFQERNLTVDLARPQGERRGGFGGGDRPRRGPGGGGFSRGGGNRSFRRY